MIFHEKMDMLNVFIALILLKVKKSDDMLEGVNKLDSLMRYSNFQVYKDKRNDSNNNQSMNASVTVPEEFFKYRDYNMVTVTSEQLNRNFSLSTGGMATPMIKSPMNANTIINKTIETEQST